MVYNKIFPKKKADKAEKIQFIVSLVIRFTLLIAILTSSFNKKWTVLFVSLLTLILTFIPSIIEKNYRISLPSEFEFIIVIFIFASIFLGGIREYYTRFWWWDIALHTISGLVLGFVGFLVLFIFHKEKKISARPSTIALFSFFFALGIGALWEIFEFSMDSFFGLNMQKSGLVDTMWDLTVDAGGALATSILGYFYMKGNKTYLFYNLVKNFIKENPKLNYKQKTK